MFKKKKKNVFDFKLNAVNTNIDDTAVLLK